MSSFFDEASLVFIPSGYKTSKAYSVKPTDGSGDLTFTRSNDTATRVGPDGLIEKVRTNLVTYSQDFGNADWIVSNLTKTTGQTDPNGGTTAVLLTSTGTSSVYLYQSSTGAGCMSVYAKAGTRSNFSIVPTSFGNGAFFNLATQTTSVAGIGSLAKIESVGGGWFRCSVAFTSSGNFLLSLTDLGGGGAAVSDTMSFAFAQFETGDIATPYIATTTAAVSVGPVANVPRLDYLNSSCPRLLLEGQRQNLVTFSESFNNTGTWYTADTTVSANIATSPDGYTNADRLATTAANGYLSNAVAISISADASSYTQSIFVKWVSGSEVIKLRAALTGGTSVAKESSINIRTGVVVSTDTTAQVVSYGSGWYRISHQITNNSTNTTAVYQFYPTNDGTNTNVIYLWGAQLEAGAYATSYVPTLGAAVTRGADAAYKASISTLIGQTEGVAFIDFVWNGLTGVGSYPRVIELWGDSNNYIQLFTVSGSANIYWDLYVGGAVQASGNAAMALGRNKIAVAYKTNDFAIYKNGTLIVSDTSCTVPATSSLGVAGSYAGSGAQLAASVNQALLFKTRLTNAQLAELTTI